VAGYVLTTASSGLAHWGPPGGGADSDWDIINANRLELGVPAVLGNDAAVMVDFSNSSGSVAPRGILVESSQLNDKGGQIGVEAKTSITATGHPQSGSVEARLAQVSGYELDGSLLGVYGMSDPSSLSNFDAAQTSFAAGGRFRVNPSSLTLSGTGTYYVGGVLGEVDGTVDGSGIVAGVIGIDNNSGTAASYAGYFDGDVEIMDQIRIRGGGPVLNEVLTCDGTGLATWAPVSSISNDSDWDIINANRLELGVPAVLGNDAAVDVSFSNSGGSVAPRGILVESSQLTDKGGQIGVEAKTSIDATNHSQKGSVQARLAQVSGYTLDGSLLGVYGISDPSSLSNFDAAQTSFAAGGRFRVNPSSGLTLSGTGTYYVGGVLGEVDGIVDGSGIVAGVIGVDNNAGSATSYAGYFDGNVHVVGNVYATGLVTWSDARYKKDVENLSSSLDKVLGMRGVNYRWRRDEFPEKKFCEGNQIGFIAQEIKDVLPEVVHQGKDGYYSVDYSKVTPLLLEAIKELKAENDALKSRLKSTDARLSQLTAMVETILAQQDNSGNGSDDLAVNR